MILDHDPHDRHHQRSALESWAVFFLAIIAIWQAFGVMKKHPRLWWWVAVLLFIFYVVLPLLDHSANGVTGF